MSKLDELLETALKANVEAFRAVCEAEKIIYAAPLTTLKNPVIAAHSALLQSKNELRWMLRERPRKEKT